MASRHTELHWAWLHHTTDWIPCSCCGSGPISRRIKLKNSRSERVFFSRSGYKKGEMQVSWLEMFQYYLVLGYFSRYLKEVECWYPALDVSRCKLTSGGSSGHTEPHCPSNLQQLYRNFSVKYVFGRGNGEIWTMRNLTSPHWDNPPAHARDSCCVYCVFLQRNIRRERDVRVWDSCACGWECERVLHGHVPLMSVNHRVLQLRVCGYHSHVFMPDLSTPVVSWVYRSDFIFL